MTCAVMIKMISKTSATSTKGVTLISAMAGRPRDRLPPPAPVRLNAMIFLASLARDALDHIHEFERKVVESVAHFFQFAAEDVIENRRWNGGNQSDARSDQRIGNTRPHRSNTRTSRRAQITENADYSHNSAEQSYKRRNRRNGCEP